MIGITCLTSIYKASMTGGVLNRNIPNNDNNNVGLAAEKNM